MADSRTELKLALMIQIIRRQDAHLHVESIGEFANHLTTERFLSGEHLRDRGLLKFSVPAPLDLGDTLRSH